MFSSRNFMDSDHKFKSLIHLELIFVYGLFLVPSHLLRVKLVSTRGAEQACCCPPGGFPLVGRTDNDQKAGEMFVPKDELPYRASCHITQQTLVV